MSNRRSVNQKPAPKKGKGGAKGPGPFKPSIRLPRQPPPGLVPDEQRPAAPTRKPLEPVTTLAPVLAATEKFAETSNGFLQQVGKEADEALAIGKRVLTMLNVENKNLSYNTAGATVDWAGLQYSPLTGITQGDTDAQRDGDSIKLKHWNGKLSFVRQATDAVVAFMVIQEGPTFITTIQQLFEGAGTNTAALSQRSWDSRQGYRVLDYRVRALTLNDPYWIMDFDHKFNHDVQYYNNSTTVYEGRVLLVVISDYTGGAPPAVKFDTQLTWIDN